MKRTLRATMDGDASISANDCNEELLLEQDFCIRSILAGMMIFIIIGYATSIRRDGWIKKET